MITSCPLSALLQPPEVQTLPQPASTGPGRRSAAVWPPALAALPLPSQPAFPPLQVLAPAGPDPGQGGVQPCLEAPLSSHLTLPTSTVPNPFLYSLKMPTRCLCSDPGGTAVGQSCTHPLSLEEGPCLSTAAHGDSIPSASLGWLHGTLCTPCPPSQSSRRCPEHAHISKARPPLQPAPLFSSCLTLSRN